MIHDLFIRRYPQVIYFGDQPTPAMHRFLMQAAHVVFVDVAPKLRLEVRFFQHVHDAVARELGQGRLFDAPSYDAICGGLLCERHDVWNDRHGVADTFLKVRLSLIELLFRALEECVRTPRAQPPARRTLFGRSAEPVGDLDGAEVVAEAVRELNVRFRQAGMGLHYHNGVIQFSKDELTEETTAEPCWSLLHDPKWANVDRDLKEALDRADGGRTDAAFHAAKALESTIKIISDERGWTTGRERGAAAYVDNLLSQRNGRFIEPWEADMLRGFFVHVRNPHGHGPGSQPPVVLADHQVRWAIETVMSWIKSLILRL